MSKYEIESSLLGRKVEAIPAWDGANLPATHHNHDLPTGFGEIVAVYLDSDREVRIAILFESGRCHDHYVTMAGTFFNFIEVNASGQKL